MRIGLDYRPAIIAPRSGIARQVFAMEEAIRARFGTSLKCFSEAPLDHSLRSSSQYHCPPWPCPINGMFLPQQRLRFEGRFLPRELKRLEFDCYIATANMGLPLFTSPGTHNILLLHDLFQITERNYHASFLKGMIARRTDRISIAHSLRVASRIWTPSRFTAEEATRLFPFCARKIRILPNMVISFTGEPVSIDRMNLPDEFWLVVGTREPRKNIPWFINAWHNARLQSQLSDSNQLPALVLVGDLTDLPKTQRNLPGLYVLNQVNDSELHALYRAAKHFWHPSFAEGFGLPVIEALGVGTPVAVANGSALDEITPPGTLRFDPRDTQALIRLMLEVNALKNGNEPSATSLAWAERYAEKAYRTRLNELLDEIQGAAP